MSLSTIEINELISKLRVKYQEYSQQYNPTWFNRDAFEERLRMAITKNMNMEGFILAEISNFEKIKEKYDSKKKAADDYSGKIDRIIEENTARVRKYPEISFHNQAGFEISHFYGAMVEFSQHCFAILSVAIDDSSLKNLFYNIENSLIYFATPRGNQHPKRIEDHILLLNRPDAQELEIERDKSEYLKECAFVLHEIIDLCEGLLDQRNPEWDTPLRMDRIFLEDKRKKRIIEEFTGYTVYGALVKVKERALDIIEDFRLTAFKRRD